MFAPITDEDQVISLYDASGEDLPLAILNLASGYSGRSIVNDSHTEIHASFRNPKMTLNKEFVSERLLLWEKYHSFLSLN